MSNGTGKTKYIWGGVVVVALVFGGFLWYQSYAKKGKKSIESSRTENQTGAQNEQSSADNLLADENTNNATAEEEDTTDYNAICEKGEWLKIADQSGAMSTVSGKLRKSYPDDETNSFKSYQYYVEGTESLGITGEKLSKLDYFEDREVEAQGVKSAGKKEIAVSQVKCTGKETDKNVLDQRKKLMSWLATNINAVAPQKAKHQKWTVDIVDFVDEKNAYVEYYDTVEDDEDSDVSDDTSRKILLEATAKPDGKYDVKVLAHWEMGEDDYVLKTGTDKFEDAETIASYQYDSDKKTWERID